MIDFTTLKDLKDRLHRDENVIIVDDNLPNLFPSLFEGLPHIPILAAEQRKNLHTIEKLYERFHALNITRHHTVIGIGGGITTDIAGYAAATWKRGCNLTLVPTTLLAMVDASIGGKNGVNFRGVKNAIGSFYVPDETIIVREFLDTLDPARILGGIGEIVKMALIDENPLYELLLEGADPTNESIIRLTIDRKLHYCRIDPHDHGERMKLNLGHTFGHLIESASDYAVPHGIAVAMGIRYAATFSREMGWISDSVEQRIASLLDWFEFPSQPDDDVLKRIGSDGATILRSDKKHGTSHLKLVCFDGFRSTFVYECVDVERILKLLNVRPEEGLPNV